MVFPINVFLLHMIRQIGVARAVLPTHWTTKADQVTCEGAMLAVEVGDNSLWTKFERYSETQILAFRTTFH